MPGRFVRPRALFFGAACSFLACCLAGRVGSQRNLFDRFERFHLYLNPSTYFYPTASQVRALGAARLEPDRIAVIVGGNSILYGVGQSEAEVWTRELQARLGDGYRVLNLAQWGAAAHECGASVAEALAAERPRLILIGLTCPTGFPGYADGLTYPYFFWDAYYKGLLQPDPGRAKALAELPAERPGLPPLQEMRARALLNSGCYFDDLWTAAAYRCGGTVWNPAMPDSWYRPRRELGEPGSSAPPPVGRRYAPEVLDREMKLVSGYFPLGCRKDAAGRWAVDPSAPAWASLEENARRCFPEPCRKRTLIVVQTESPYYLDRLPADERALYFVLSRRTAEKLEGAGFAALDMGDGFTAADFADRPHLAASGGVKLADRVAVRVRRLADELGYTRREEEGHEGR